MDHLDWYELSAIERVKVPFVCLDVPLCGANDFFDFPQRQGWELDDSESLAQLAKRAQAWLFFGLLAVSGISPEACIDYDTGEALINTKMLPKFLKLTQLTKDARGHRALQIKEAVSKAEGVMLRGVIPLIKNYEVEESLDLWNSKSFAILFSIDTLLDTFKESLGKILRTTGMIEQSNTDIGKPRTFFSKLTDGVARSLFLTGRCGSLAHRLNFTSSELLHLISLPTSQGIEDHTSCSKTSCNYFNVDQATYRTHHTENCVMCDEGGIAESDLVDLIRQDEVPVIRSSKDSNGNVSIRVEQMTQSTRYVAISHVWAGGLGNFVENQLPQCQLQTIHEDVSNLMASQVIWREAYEDFVYIFTDFPKLPKRKQNRRFSSSPASTTSYYWIDTLCIPNSHPHERKNAINSMGRIYAGAAAVLVVDPDLRSINYNQLGANAVDILIEASPWMARSWPLQEAALASKIYVKFAEASVRFEHEDLGVEATLRTLPSQHWDGHSLGLHLDGFHGGFVTGDELPYTPDTDFVKVWNLLVKRTTSQPADVPAIFAALIYRSAGEILSIEPAHRTWALLNSVVNMPLDILCIEQDSQLPQWKPRLPGSRNPVPPLDPTFGILERVVNGFVLPLRHIPTRALMIPKGLCSSGGHFLLRESQTEQSFLLHIHSLWDTNPKHESGQVEVEDSHLVLMLPKRLSGSLVMNYGILAEIRGHTENTLRVRLLGNKVVWRPHENDEQLPPHESRNCLFVDPSYSVMIEMDTEHWPSLRWSRFDVYPYRHLRAHVSMGVFSVWFLYCFCFPLSSIGFIVIIMEIASLDFPHAYPIVIALVGAWLIRTGVDVIYFKYLHTITKSRSRYFWSLGFWDVPDSKRTLSNILAPIPFYFVLIDVTIIAATYSSYMIFSDLAIVLVIFDQLGYVSRLLAHIFFQIQWFFSTLQYRMSHRSQPTLYASILKFTTSAIHANSLTAVTLCFTSLFAVLFLWMSYLGLAGSFYYWRFSRYWKTLYFIQFAMFFSFLGSILLLFSLYLLFTILRDLVRRVIWVYGRSKWERPRTVDRES